jgi:Spy/CpxP family protein refolding chaperone
MGADMTEDDLTPEQEAELRQDRADAGGLILAWADDVDGARGMMGQLTYPDTARLLCAVLGTVRDVVRLCDRAEQHGTSVSPRRALRELIAACQRGDVD